MVHDTSSIAWVPRGETILQLVWGTDGRSVRDVVVAGRPVVRQGACVSVDVAALRSEAVAAQQSLLARAGIEVPHLWPHLDSP